MAQRFQVVVNRCKDYNKGLREWRELHIVYLLGKKYIVIRYNNGNDDMIEFL